MARKYFIVHFSGHGDPSMCGKRDPSYFAKLAPLLKAGDVSRFSYFAGLGLESSDRVATQVMGAIEGYNGGSIEGVTFLIHGYSAGGITALRFAFRVPDRQIAYIGLSDAAFYRDETDFLMNFPGSTAYQDNENYYQIYQNSYRVPEIHSKVTAEGWRNYEMPKSQAPWTASNMHIAAIRWAEPQVFNRMKSIISNDL